MYTYDNGLAFDGSAVCTSKCRGGGWRHFCFLLAAPAFSLSFWQCRSPACPRPRPRPCPRPCPPLPSAAIGQYGGMDFNTDNRDSTVFSGAEGVEFWVRSADGIPDVVFRIGDIMRVSRGSAAAAAVAVAVREFGGSVAGGKQGGVATGGVGASLAASGPCTTAPCRVGVPSSTTWPRVPPRISRMAGSASISPLLISSATPG